MPRATLPHKGRCFPTGATLTAQGANFSVYARGASSLELVLFDRVDDRRPARMITLDASAHRTYHYWHVEVPGLSPGQIYAFRAHGPEQLGYDPKKVLLDPYGRGVAVPAGYDRQAGARPGDNAATAMKSLLVDRRAAYDWEGDTPLGRPFSKTVIYEMHVGGFTRHPSSGLPPERRGTYLGVVDKIPYLKQLGVTAVELLPVYHFDPQAAPGGRPNYWGYQPVSFFAAHPGYSQGDPAQEFRAMVKALHKAGIEVLLDVVYNHTAEGADDGPTFCFRGLDRDTYYLTDPSGKLLDYTGCGNTMNGNHAVVRRLILDSLRFWVQEMHVDGFRFDLASILARDARGKPLENPPILWDIESDPVLAGSKLIAEAWDAAGLYQVGSFVGDSWKEWNGKFRDDVRRFLRGESNTVARVADRLLASPDVFGHEEREPEQSINFVTCHDGFTLNDLVSYDGKHNQANGEDNRDGSNDNLSWNCGVEGPSDDPAIEELRNRQCKNFLALNLMALGTPMLLMGDEVRRTQQGNNNAYCQDNEISWFDWSLVDRHADLLRFVSLLVAAHVGRDDSANKGLTLTELLRQGRVEWHGTRLGHPDWREISHSLAFTARLADGHRIMHGMMNAYWEPLEFELPPRRWKRWLDTSLPSPEDIGPWEEAPALEGSTYRVESRSIVVLMDTL